MVSIRKTSETPPRISALDVAEAITGKPTNHARASLGRVRHKYPAVAEKLSFFRFPGRGQKRTYVVDVRGIVEIVMLLPGEQAAGVRRQAAELLCSFLGGDVAIVDEVCTMLGNPEQLAVQAPEGPRRLLGEVFADTTRDTGASQMAQMIAAMNERLTNQEKTVASIQGRLEDPNVRAPERPGPHQSHIAQVQKRKLEDATDRRAPSDQLEGLDRVLQIVVRKCKGDAFTSKGVHDKIRNLRYTLDSAKTGAELAGDVLNRLIDGGLAEVVEEGPGQKGRRVRHCRLKTWPAIQDNPASDAFRARLGLGEDDFA